MEEQPRKLEYVVKVAYSMMNQGKSIDSQSQVGTQACGVEVEGQGRAGSGCGVLHVIGSWCGGS